MSEHDQLEQRKANLSSTKRALLDKWKRGQHSGDVTPPMIQPRPQDLPVPLHSSQQQLWFIDHLLPGNSAYNIPIAARLVGPIDATALEHSFNEIVRRHASLRTTFAATNGQLIQVIHPHLELTLEVRDLRQVPDDQREAQALQLAIQEFQQPFDLEHGPLLRTTLFQLNADEHLLTLTIHHIVADAWSVGVLMQEMATLYRATIAGQPSPLPEPQLQYADFAYWQQQWLQGPELEKQLSYWRTQLADAPTMLAFPTDRPRPAIQTYGGATRFFVLPSQLVAELRAFCRQQGATLFMALLATFNVLLARYTGQDDIVVANDIANRHRPETRELIGMFVNTLILRANLAGDPTFRQLLARVREVILGAYAHQDVPLEVLVQALNPGRSLSYQALVQIFFSVQEDKASQPLTLPGIALTSLDITNQTAKFDLDFTVWEHEGELHGAVEYRTDLFDESTILRLIEHFQTLLASVLADPDQSIWHYSLLTSGEQQALAAWNDTAMPMAADDTFPALFAAQVERTPERIAVTSATMQLTYRQLDDRANRLAVALVEQQLAPEGCVSVLMDRGVDLLVAMLGSFKAGGMYLPLDPKNPPARLAHMLEQSAARVIVTTGAYLSLAEQIIAGRSERPTIVNLDQLDSDLPAANLALLMLQEQSAYTIYTSGSTGTPKGATVLHRGMLNHLLAKVHDLQLTSADIVAQTASQSFDISVWQFLVALLIGGRVHVVDDLTAQDPLQLLAEIETAQITILELVPTLLQAVLAQATSPRATRNSLSRLRWMIATGEPLPPALAQAWLQAYPQTPLLNAYGPTECSDDVTHYVIERVMPDDGVHVSIGRAIQNTRLYVLDVRLQPVPIGVFGELYVGGSGVGRGYLNDPQRTAEAFLPDPFAEQPGLRLYKTGDVARYRTNGNLEFVGRIDHQVKLRGFRIELGEIEAALNRYPGVQEALVTVGGSADDPQLVAYVVTADEHAFSPTELRTVLTEQLPAYMVPSAFVSLAAFPLTRNGKIDRQALPVPDLLSTADPREIVPPATPIEIELAELWQALLKTKQVSIHDNFFDVGGHSLQAIQLLARVAAQFSVDVRLRDFFATPTLHGLAMLIEEALLANTSSGRLDELMALIEDMDEEAPQQ